MLLRYFPLLVVLGSCIGSNYRIRGSELDRIAAQPHEERGALLRATQDVWYNKQRVDGEEVTRAEDIARLLGRETARGVEHADTRRRAMRRRQRRGGVEHPPSNLGVAPERGRAHLERDESPQTLGLPDGQSLPDVRALPAVALAVISGALCGAGIGIIILAGAEGARYDGWLQVEANHNLHLFQNRPGQDRLWIGVPVADMSPEMAAWADGAILDAKEGPVFRLWRAPLDRQGLTLSVAATGARLFAVTPERVWGGGVRTSVGGFPVQHFGVQMIMDLQGASGVFNVRFGGELQGFAPAVGRANFGAYFEGGLVRTSQRGADRSLTAVIGYYGGGGIFQLELTTRLSVDVRGGLYVADGHVFPTFGAGLTVF